MAGTSPAMTGVGFAVVPARRDTDRAVIASAAKQFRLAR
jgi:hypothetical protein